MIVKELIEKLQKMPEDLIVMGNVVENDEYDYLPVDAVFKKKIRYDPDGEGFQKRMKTVCIIAVE